MESAGSSSAKADSMIQREPSLSGSPNLISLPLELLQEVCLYLEQSDVGGLRLASLKCSNISIQYMLRTLTFRLTLDGILRVLALGKIPAFSNFVQKLIVETVHGGDQLLPRSKMETDRLKSRNTSVLKELAFKYIGIAIDEEDMGFPLRMPHYVSHHITGDSTERSNARETLQACLDRFHNIQVVSLNEDGHVFDWTVSGDLAISERGLPCSGETRGPQNDLARWLLLKFPGCPADSAPAQPTHCHESEGIRSFPEIRSLRLTLSLSGIMYEAETMRLCKELISPGDRRKVKCMSLNFSNDAAGVRKPIQPIKATEVMGLRYVAEACQSFLRSYVGVEEIEINWIPYRPIRDYYHENLPLLPAELFHYSCSSRIQKLDIGYFAADVQGLNKMLYTLRATLRELTLTRVNLSHGSWAEWFSMLQRRCDMLEIAGFRGIFLGS